MLQKYQNFPFFSVGRRHRLLRLFAHRPLLLLRPDARGRPRQHRSDQEDLLLHRGRGHPGGRGALPRQAGLHTRQTGKANGAGGHARGGHSHQVKRQSDMSM